MTLGEVVFSGGGLFKNSAYLRAITPPPPIPKTPSSRGVGACRYKQDLGSTSRLLLSFPRAVQIHPLHPVRPSPWRNVLQDCGWSPFLRKLK